MNCDTEKLREIIIEAAKDETGIAGVPIVVAEKRALKKTNAVGMDCNLNQIQDIIQRLLDGWEIDKTIDELNFEELRGLGLPEVEGFTWHLKVLAPEKKEFYQSLTPRVKALIKLLREQNNPQRLGVMPKEEAVRKLREEGLEGDLEYIHAKNVIEDFATIWDGKSMVWCYGLVKEYEKTKEFKDWQKDMFDKSAEREGLQYRKEEEYRITNPIYAYLDRLTEKQEEDLETLAQERRKMSKDDYPLKKTAIETRGEEEVNGWKRIIDAIPSLSFDDLLRLQKLFLENGLPLLDEVTKFLSGLNKQDT
jgi:hypothetical protein